MLFQILFQLQCVELDVKMITNGEQLRICKEVVTVNFKVIFQHYLKMEEKTGKPVMLVPPKPISRVPLLQ
jgi:hypothetical protein